MAKISFGTVEELFSELKEKNQTEARIEPIVQRKMIGKNISVPYLIHQIKVTALIEGMVAEVVIEYHTYPQVSDEQISTEKSEAFWKRAVALPRFGKRVNLERLLKRLPRITQ